MDHRASPHAPETEDPFTRAGGRLTRYRSYENSAAREAEAREVELLPPLRADAAS